MNEIKTCGTLFSGFGGSDCGFRAAGLTPVVAVEYDPKLAEVYRANHGDHVTVADVRDVDFKKLERPNLLGLSPVCIRASIANTGSEESTLDIECAEASMRAVETWMPEAVIVENVYGYRNFKSFKLILAGFERLGYTFDYWHLNAANYGVPQTRQRLILIAHKHRQKPNQPERTHDKEPVPALFGTLERWVGWYEAVEDILHTLPDTQFAQWQLDRLSKSKVGYETFLMGDQKNQTVNSEQPAFTLTAKSNSHGPAPVRAFIVEGSAAGNDNKFTMPIRNADEPIFTQRAKQNMPRAFIVDGQQTKPSKSGLREDRELITRDCEEPLFTIPSSIWKGMPTAQEQTGRVVAMTPRALARFQSFPDWFELSGHRKTDCIGIGNAVPPLLAEAVAKSILSAHK